MRVGVLGGTFNPPHNGHLTAAHNVYKALELDKVLFIPTNIPPHKMLPHGSATTEQRCQMVQLMTKDMSWASFCDIEIARGGASYTVETLRALKQNPDFEELVLIIGTDMLMSFDTIWRNPDEIAQLATLAVVARVQDNQQVLHKKADKLRKQLGANIVVVDGPVLEISSTELRQGAKISEYTSLAVAEFIEKHELY